MDRRLEQKPQAEEKPRAEPARPEPLGWTVARPTAQPPEQRETAEDDVQALDLNQTPLFHRADVEEDEHRGAKRALPSKRRSAPSQRSQSQREHPERRRQP